VTTHPVRWQSPQPLWARFGSTLAAAVSAVDQTRPAILRFATDDFMEQLLAVLEADPHRLGDFIARPETWRGPQTDPPDAVDRARLPRLPQIFPWIRKKQSTSTTLTPTISERTDLVHGQQVKVPLKLYHPAHQRHYIVAANLVCALPGFPEKTVGTGRREQVAFVLRRLLPVDQTPNAPKREYAFVKDARGPHWELVTPDASAGDAYAHTATGEELLPLFPLNFSDDLGHPRRLRAGVIPVGRREEYMGSARYETGLAPGTTTPPVNTSDPVIVAKTKKSARKEQLKFDVTEPWKALIRATYKAAEQINREDKSGTSAADQLTARRKFARQANEGAQLPSWLILLDFADYLATHVPTVWSAVNAQGAPVGLKTGEQSLFNWINTASMAPASGWQLTGLGWQFPVPFVTTLRAVLTQISGARAALESAERTFSLNDATTPWPPFYHLLTGIAESRDLGGDLRFTVGGVQASLDTATALAAEDADVEVMPAITDAETEAQRVDRLVQLVMAAVDADAQTPAAAPIPFAVQLRDAMSNTPGDPGWFVLRCVYVHCECCGPLEPDILSAPSQQFQLASFFDSDAPARPIRIALPIDTTAAGLRKHQKNTAFVLSDALCGQVNRLKGLGFVDLVLSVLPWPFHKDLDIGSDGLGPCKSKGQNFGMICSLSIPIITICALILLFMIVLVLDIIFHWIPWLIICFPIRFKSKQPA